MKRKKESKKVDTLEYNSVSMNESREPKTTYAQIIYM